MTFNFQWLTATLRYILLFSQVWAHARLTPLTYQKLSREHYDPAPQVKRGNYLGMLTSMN